MKRVIAAAITLLCVACGGPSDEATPARAKAAPTGRAEKGGNAPPEISSASLEPASAGAGDQISVAVVANDADRDHVRLTVEWYRNADLVSDLDDTSVPAGTFARGDRVYAIVYASDGKDEVSQQTAPLLIANSAPTLRRVVITPSRPSALDLLEVDPQVTDEDGDPVSLSYRWLRNGQPVPDGTSPRLAPGVGHRGEQIVAQVKASDGNDESPWVSSAPVAMANAAPAIKTQPNYTLSGSGQYSYEVAAEDPDGDRPLKYELVQGPQGMSVDVTSGRVTWHVPESAKGVYPIELAVSDPYGGKTTQSYSLAVGWNEAPANASGAVKPAKAAAKPGKAAAQRDEDYTDQDQGEEAADDEF